MKRHYRRITEYEYGYQDDPEYRRRRPRDPRLSLLDKVLFLLVIPLPILGLILSFLELSVPLMAIKIYAAITQTAAGLLFIILTALGVGGFGKVGYFFTHTRGRRWMTTEEAKGNTYLFGTIMLAIGILLTLSLLKLL